MTVIAKSYTSIDSVRMMLSALILISEQKKQNGFMECVGLNGNWHGEEMVKELRETFSGYLNQEELKVEVEHIGGDTFKATLTCIEHNISVLQEFELEGGIQ